MAGAGVVVTVAAGWVAAGWAAAGLGVVVRAGGGLGAVDLAVVGLAVDWVAVADWMEATAAAAAMVVG